MPKTSPREALEQVLLAVRGEPLVILITGHPDPDAIGAALAHQRICETLGVPATIAHVHPLSHRENRALVKLLHVDMVQVSTRADLARFKHLSLVDTTAPDPAIELPADLHLLSIVDHHRPIGNTEAPFVDSRPDLGASCTMYCEYLSQGLAPFGGERQDAKVATALLFGIQTDTDDFQLATPDDFRAAAYAKAFCDTDLLVRVGRRTVGAAAMDVLGRALASLVVIRDFALAGVERVSANDRDSIGGAADFILRREDIDTVLVYGIVEDRIDGSLRTRSPSVDPASFLQTAFGRDRDGRPYGGGRADKGGFQIPLGVLADSDPDALWNIVQESVENRIARVVPELDHSRDTRHPEAVRTIMKSLHFPPHRPQRETGSGRLLRALSFWGCPYSAFPSLRSGAQTPNPPTTRGRGRVGKAPPHQHHTAAQRPDGVRWAADAQNDVRFWSICLRLDRRPWTAAPSCVSDPMMAL